MNSIAMNILVHAAVGTAAAAAMEGVAGLLHRYVMHGIGWYLHEDHHNHRNRPFEKNDGYALFFALVSFLLIYNGLLHGLSLMVAAGAGTTLYGIGYVMFHDIMFHRRVKRLRLTPKHPYLKRIINAHRLHHAAVTREDAVCFNFLWAPKYYHPKNQEAVDRDIQGMIKQQLAKKRSRD